MSNASTTDDGTSYQPPPDDGGGGGQGGDDLAGLREAAKRGKEATARAEAAERELAFMRAGLTPEILAKPIGQMFVTSYTGELTPEAIRAAAIEVTLLEAEGTNEPTDLERQEAEMRARLAGDAGVPPGGIGTGPHPREVAMQNYRDAVAKGTPEEIAKQHYVAELISLGGEGDNRVWFNQAQWDQEAQQYGSGPR